MSHKIEYAMVWKRKVNRHQPVAQSKFEQLTWRTTMKNKRPQAICTRRRPMTITTPPTWPSKFTRTKTVARNFPQFHDAFMYSFCSFHLKLRDRVTISLEDSERLSDNTYCTHIRIPSSKNVARNLGKC